MNLKELNQKLENISLEKETKESLLDVIEYRISTDMEKVIAEMKGLRSEMSTSIGSLKSENRIIYWVVGIAFLAITSLLTIIAFKK